MYGMVWHGMVWHGMVWNGMDMNVMVCNCMYGCMDVWIYVMYISMYGCMYKVCTCMLYFFTDFLCHTVLMRKGA